MKTTNERVSELIFKLLKQEATEAERAELEAWKQNTPEHVVFIDKIFKEGFVPQGLRELEQARQKSSEQLAAKSVPLFKEEETVTPAAHRVHFLKTSWFRYAAAVVLIAGAATVWYEVSRSGRHEEVATTNGNKHLQTDVPPGGDKAVLTLADGTKILLDNAQNGNLAQQGNTKVIKLDNGQLAYNAGKSFGKEILYNTISTPRGGQYQIVLPDGSKVWLNSQSSIKFPTTFSGAERNVDISGEVYMEIAQRSKQPFIVKANGMEVQVLGTSFNINAYSDESAIKTTLVEGSVKVLRGNSQAILTPGQQAQLTQQKLSVVKDADIEKTIAWKNGFFNFNGAGVEEVMRQLARWYDIQVVYEKGIPDIEFVGKISRNVSLSGVLKGLEGAGVHFRIEGGKKLIIFP